MSFPKNHHYVPRFYLSRFTDEKGKLWVYDKVTQKIFPTAVENVGSQTHFYRLDELTKDGLDPLEMEKQFAGLESEAQKIAENWFEQLLHTDKLTIPEVNRNIMSLFITTQLLRTVEAREHLVQFSGKVVENYDARKDAKQLQARFLWEDTYIVDMKNRISSCIWVIGRNNSSTPFCISDHPVQIKTQDNTRWLNGPRVFDKGMYIVYPLSTKLILYCKDPEAWQKIKVFENSVTPVEFDDEMVMHENSGQIGMSYRFIYSSKNDFDFAKEFLKDQSDYIDPMRERY